MHFETSALHAGQEPDASTGAVIPPLSLSTTFVQHAPGKPVSSYDYSRSSNPTRESFEACVAALESGKHALAFASGLAATATVIHLLEAGDHVISIDDVYGGTQRYFRRVAAKFGVSFSFVDMTRPGEYERELAAQPRTKLVWLETPTNPTLKVVDVASVAAATPRGVVLLVDNTFASPYCQRPLELGATISFSSVSKYINGHSDVIGGVLCLNDDGVAERLRFLQNSIGGVPSPFDCYLALRGAKTLALRMRQHSENAMRVAKWLEAHPRVERVLYPGLPSHPQHEVARRNAAVAGHFGGMVTFFVDGARLDKLRVIALAESLGGVESLIEAPALMTHASVPPETRAELGISDSLIRLSVGIEHCDDIIADLQRCIPES